MVRFTSLLEPGLLQFQNGADGAGRQHDVLDQMISPQNSQAVCIDPLICGLIIG
jgi:hypothetical protein